MGETDLHPITRTVSVPGTKTEGSAAVLRVADDMWPWIVAAVPAPVEYNWLRIYWKRALKAVGADETLRLHDLRHLTAQLLVNAGQSEASVQTTMRHATASMTRRYAMQWEIAATESYLYSGVGRGFEPSLVNPLNIYALSWRNETQDGNLGLGLEGSIRTRAGSFAAHAFIDDLQIDRCDPNCEEPSSYGVTMTAEGLPLAGDQHWFASYARVSYLAYRTPNPNERYSAFNVGLGQGFSDFDEVRVGLDLAVMPRIPLRLYVASRRQGEGDYRAPYPAAADYATTPTIFGGIVSRIARLGLNGASRFNDFELSGDLGVNRVSDGAEQRGVSTSGFQGTVKLAWEPKMSVSF